MSKIMLLSFIKGMKEGLKKKKGKKKKGKETTFKVDSNQSMGSIVFWTRNNGFPLGKI